MCTENAFNETKKLLLLTHTLFKIYKTRLEENAHDFLRVPIGAGVLVHSFSMYSFVLDFSITQQQLINETLSFFYSYSFISLSLSPSLSLSDTLGTSLLTCLRSLR